MGVLIIMISMISSLFTNTLDLPTLPSLQLSVVKVSLFALAPQDEVNEITFLTVLVDIIKLNTKGPGFTSTVYYHHHGLKCTIIE